MTQSDAPAVNCLTINLLSFSIPPNIILETDQLWVKAKIYPDGDKQKFDIKGKKMGSCNLIYRFNITNQTEKLHFIFRKKTFLSGNQTVGTSDIDIAELRRSTSDSNSSSTKTLDIFYPIERQLREQQPHGVDRSSIKEKVIGQMKFSFSLSEPLAIDQSSKDQKKKDKKDKPKRGPGSYSTENLI